MKRDFYHNTKVVQTITPRTAESAGAINGSAVDLSDCGAVLVVASVGDMTLASVTFTVQESANGTSWADVPAVSLISDTGANGWAKQVTTDDTTVRCAYIGTKRYIRAVATVAGQTPVAPLSVVVVKGRLDIEG